jgi:hypothetical protein
MSEPSEPSEPDIDMIPIEEARLLFAVDTSMSTLGWTLNGEKRFITRMLQQLPPQARDGVEIIGWSDEQVVAETPDSLKVRAFTIPVLLFHPGQSRNRIFSSNLWFFMTDGGILDDAVKDLSRALLKCWPHGRTSCVVVMFGSASPAASASEYGISTSFWGFAGFQPFVSFADRGSSDVFILYAKRDFWPFLRGRMPSQNSRENK